MKSKKYLRLVISLLCFMLIFAAAVNIIIDPLFQYHKPLFGMQPVIKNGRYQNAGIIRTLDYDSAIIGNSMCENFQVSHTRRILGDNTVKLAMSGTNISDWKYMFDIISNRKMPISNIMMNIDSYVLSSKFEPEDSTLPVYLYDNNFLNDINYLLNFAIMKNHTVATVKKNINNDIPNYDIAFMWDGNFGKKYVLEEYEKSNTGYNNIDINGLADTTAENIQEIINFAKKMNQTKFLIFFSPYSILAYDEMIKSNCLNDFEKAYFIAAESLIENDNISVFFWNDQDYRSNICNLSLYKDIKHYDKSINDDIIDRISDGKGLLTKENYKSEISDFFDFVRSYDYESIFK